MTSIYDRFGVSVIINASGPSTRLSGGPMRPEVAQAMAEAAGHCVDIAELQAAAGRVIARLTGAEAGYVSSGAAAGLLLATAASIARLDPARMNRLPDTSGLPNEVVIARSHRNQYDHAVRGAGARLVEVGISDRYAGAGVRDAEAWEFKAAINDRTAAVYYLAGRRARPSLTEVVAVAHAHDLPVIVDAAAQLPAMANLRRFIAEGADLVAFSGGKAIGGPQASGILCGRRDLIMSAALQHLDMDVAFERWNPPADLIDKSRLVGAPHHGIGRPCKVGKEQIVGLVTALELASDEAEDAARQARWRDLAGQLAAALGGLNNAAVELADDPDQGGVPAVLVTLDPTAPGLSAEQAAVALEAGDPPIHVDPSRLDENMLIFGVTCLKDGEPEPIARALRNLLAGSDHPSTR